MSIGGATSRPFPEPRYLRGPDNSTCGSDLRCFGNRQVDVPAISTSPPKAGPIRSLRPLGELRGREGTPTSNWDAARSALPNRGQGRQPGSTARATTRRRIRIWICSVLFAETVT